MRLAPAEERTRTAADLTARARIRDAAIELFARRGFGVPVRVIAAAAAVSPGLVIHHFGSKDGLREVCDGAVLEVVRTLKAEAVSPQRQTVWAYLTHAPEYASVLAYVVASLQAGGPAAHAFFEHFVADMQEWMAAGVEAGTVRPSRDPAARARYLAGQGLGGLLLHVALRSDGGSDLAAVVGDLTRTEALPALELFTEGLLTDSRMLDEYLMYVPDPPGAADSDA